MRILSHGFHPPTLRDILHLRKPVRDVNAEHEESLSPLERLAIQITDRIGTMGFFFLIVGWTAFWLGWNFLAPRHLQFDPPMAFVFWLFISNMIQIFLMPLLMIGQNLQGRHAERRAENDYEVNLKAEKEICVVLHHLEYQNTLLHALVEKQGMTVQQIAEQLVNQAPEPSKDPE